MVNGAPTVGGGSTTAGNSNAKEEERQEPGKVDVQASAETDIVVFPDAADRGKVSENADWFCINGNYQEINPPQREGAPPKHQHLEKAKGVLRKTRNLWHRS